jgi:hypothetical protein
LAHINPTTTKDKKQNQFEPQHVAVAVAEAQQAMATKTQISIPSTEKLTFHATRKPVSVPLQPPTQSKKGK